MAHEKMQLAVPRINDDMLGIQLGGSDSLPRKYHKQKHCKSLSEVHRVSPLAWTNSDDSRYPMLTVLTLEPNGHWKIIAVPFQYPDSEPLGSEARVSSDCLVSIPRPISSSQDDIQNLEKDTEDKASSPITQNKVSSKATWKEIPKHFRTSSSTSIKPTPVLTSDSTVDDAAKRSSGKKNKKKPKRGKKNSCQSGSTEPEASLVKDQPRVGLVSGTCNSNDVDHKETTGALFPRNKARDSKAGILNVIKETNHPPVHDVSLSKPYQSSKRWEKENVKAEVSGLKKGSPCNNGKEDHLATTNRSAQNQSLYPFSSFNGYRSTGNYRGQMGKESTRAIWQKVQRNCTDESGSDVNRVPVASSFKRNSDDFEQAKQLKDTVCSERRTKSGCGSKGDFKFSSESGSDNETVSSDSARVTSNASDQNATPRDSISPPKERICSEHSGLISQTIGVTNHSLAVSCDSFDQSKMLQVPSPEFIPSLFGNSVRQALESIYFADSGCTTQKWVPIGLKESPTFEDTVKSKTTHESQDVASKAEESIGQTTGDILQVSMFDGKSNISTKTRCSDAENGVSVVSEPAVDDITEAVNRAYKLQLESEAIEKASGCPLAEFERLLQKSCPVIYQPIRSICNACSRDQFGGISLCRHERPDAPLSSIWKWYEELGVCGLEVNGDDYEKAKRFGVDFSPFSAYFVPYLSAVQLFGNGYDQSGNSNSNVSSSEVDSESFPTELKQLFNLESSSVSAKDIGRLRSAGPSMSNDPELLFEYFELEPPQQRRTLYEKIQQLIVGDGLSQNQGQGDPTNLDRIKLNELHHKSWYSVAWYPIYRIPEDNFRAAFLTFHSLGHLMCRSSRFDLNGVQDCIVCPAVGLQSYNAQSECWFSPRSPVPNQKKATAPDKNHHEILKERLRTLEETASLMARAIVKKGNLTSVNQHPDYEFFCSRKRW